MLRGRNLKQAYKPSGSSSMPSASPLLDFAGYFKVFIPQARWFIIIGTLYNSLFLQSALQSFFSPDCVPCLPSAATIIGFGGGGTSFPREKKMLFLIRGTCWGFTFVSALLFFFWSYSLQLPVTCFFAPTQTCTHWFPTSVLKSHTALLFWSQSPSWIILSPLGSSLMSVLGTLAFIPLPWACCLTPWVPEPGMMLVMSAPCCDNGRHRSYHLHLELHLLRF